MPIIRNILRVQGGSAKAAALFDFIADRTLGRGSVDFNRITPMPPWVYREPTNRDLLKKYGKENCSRGWCMQNWGCAQNVLHPEETQRLYDNGDTLRFDTEDNEVWELIQKLSLIFKDVYLDYLWASEDVGSNVGAMQFKDGEILIEFIPAAGSRVAVEKSLDILGARAADFGLVYDANSGNYEYRGSDRLGKA